MSEKSTLILFLIFIIVLTLIFLTSKNLTVLGILVGLLVVFCIKYFIQKN